MADLKKTSRRGRLGASQALIAATVAGSLLVSASASAQWLDEGIMPPRAIGQIVMRNGYSGFSPPRLAGDVYIVHAVDMDGARVRLVIDAYDGHILRPVRSVERFAPPRSVERFRPRDYEVEIEREYVERPRSEWPVRGALVPPRSIPGEVEPDDLMPRETRAAPAAPERGHRSAPSVATRPESKQRAARVEPPAGETAAPASRAKQRETSRSAPAAPTVTPAAPAPVVEAPKPASAPGAKPATTAAAPTPATPKEVPVTPAAPAPTIEAKPAASTPAKPEAPQAAKPEVPQPAKAEPTQAARPADPKPADPKPADTKRTEAKQAAEVSKPAAQREATASTSPAPAVRVIQGVTPIIPQVDGSSEPEKISQ